MSDATSEQPTTTFWVLAALFLLWNLVGLMFYYMQVTMSPEVLAENFDEVQQAFLNDTPVWATSAYAIAVTAGVLAGALMLLRRSVAVTLFIVSFVAVLVQDFDAFVLRNGLDVWGQSGLYLPSFIVIVGIAEIWYTRLAKSKGWLA